MQVRQVLVASMLVVTAIGALAQEIDRSETLQGKSLAAQQEQAAGPHGRTRDSVIAEAHNLAAAGQLKVGERAEAPTVNVLPDAQYAQGKTRDDVKAELAQWRATHKLVVGELI